MMKCKECPQYTKCLLTYDDLRAKRHNCKFAKNIYKPNDNANHCCFICKKNIDGCSWSRNLEPVKGWKAVVDNRSGSYIGADYKILYCPEFEEGDSSKGKKYDAEKGMELLEVLYKGTADDYKRAYKQKLKLERRNATLFWNEIEIAENTMRECSFLLGKWTEKLKRIVEEELDLEDGDSDG